ncbi:LexA family transcriptional regulator [Streptococcus suis]|uniref:XRE family transcriptional regulator n=1 Tax=Streptococcus suis TaxID=1307 RepID=UPI0019210184|nr:XRE family transcriptional regulator [Streptococcus suis]MBL1126038.1 LexA family transcriptional regulator [Streptococcus suis]HEM6179912.1 LexA family transcriptional regulator [Streptococcus suis]HEM6357169.1 LexA family transcriptional regulator [Streptococcus suis]HEM6381335.1 LexA family transcriptional regulator [Streptococcus suis]HEM6410697.1 LexA family transcriptional regulator [Streptococcus suis]
MSLGNKQIIAENIKRLLDRKGLNPRQMALALDFKYTTVLDWVNAKTYPRIDKIEIMANYFGVNKSDLIEKKTSVVHSSNIDSDIVTLANTLTSSNRAIWVDYGRELLHKQNASIVEELAITYEVKAVSRLAAGVGFGYDDNDVITVQVTNEPPKHDIASIVDGDSMTPNYHDGDVIYLRDKGISSYSGQVCAVVVDDKTYLKRVYTEATGLRLVSINKKYNDIVIDFPPSEDTHIKVFSVVGSDRVI